MGKVKQNRSGGESIRPLDVDRLHLLMELTGQINSNLDLDSLLLDIIKAAKILMDSEASSLMLVDDKTDELVLSIPTGPVTNELSGIRFPKQKGIGGWVVENNESAITEDVYSDSRFLGDFRPDLFKTTNLICVPLRNQHGDAIGALQAMNKKEGEPFTDNDHTVFQALANQAAIAIRNAKLHEEQLQKQLLEQQLNLATTIQTGFWPKKTPDLPGYQIAGTSRPATWVGGDYYDFIETEQETLWGLAVADVTGKGMAAALLMAGLRSVLRAQVENNHPMEESVSRVNRSIYNDTPSDKFITMLYGELDIKTHTFTYVNAGHNAPYLVDFSKKKVTALEEAGLILGIMGDVTYQRCEVQLEPGQMVVIFSDGITEAQNEEGDFYEEEAFERWLINHPNNSPSEIITLILRELEQFRGTRLQSDDITIIVFKREEE